MTPIVGGPAQIRARDQRKRRDLADKLQDRLARAHPAVFTVVAGLAGFCTYFSMYAFRKPFTAATFEALTGYMPAEFSRFLVYDPAAGRAMGAEATGACCGWTGCCAGCCWAGWPPTDSFCGPFGPALAGLLRKLRIRAKVPAPIRVTLKPSAISVR